jgi:hypothetical protein
MALVHAATELRLLAAGQGAAGVAAVLLAVGVGDVGDFTPLEVFAVLLVLGLSVAGALGRLVLGRRTGPHILYRQMLERSPPPPPDASGERLSHTAVRAAGVSAAFAVAFLVAAAVLLAFALVLMGKPRDEVTDHLAAAAALVAAGWLLAGAATARVIAGWFARWERQRGRLVLCPPLRAATMGPVYFVAPAP